MQYLAYQTHRKTVKSYKVANKHLTFISAGSKCRILLTDVVSLEKLKGGYVVTFRRQVVFDSITGKSSKSSIAPHFHLMKTKTGRKVIINTNLYVKD